MRLFTSMETLWFLYTEEYQRSVYKNMGPGKTSKNRALTTIALSWWRECCTGRSLALSISLQSRIQKIPDRVVWAACLAPSCWNERWVCSICSNATCCSVDRSIWTRIRHCTKKSQADRSKKYLKPDHRIDLWRRPLHWFSFACLPDDQILPQINRLCFALGLRGLVPLPG